MIAITTVVLASCAPQDPAQTTAAEQRADETLVTARKLEEPLADLPLSATVVEADELESFSLDTIRDAGERIPNLYLSEFSSRRLSFPFVRGVGSGLNDPAVITYVDDVPQFGFGGTNLPLFEVERVEFLRGPQGTLYGRNALGGLFHVRGRRPTLERETGGAVTFGSFDLQEFSYNYSGPIGSVPVAFGVLESERDGYSKNDFTGHDVDDRDGLFGRGQVLLQTGESSEVQLGFFGEHARDGGFALSFLEDMPLLGVNGLRDEPHHVNQDFEGETERDVYQPSAVWRVSGEELDFTSVSAFQSWDVLETSDFDFSPADIVRRRTEEDQHYLYQEFRVGTPAETERSERELSWLAGASGFWSEADRSAENAFGTQAPPPLIPNSTDSREGDFDDYGVALFGQATLPVGEKLDLTAGLRLDYENKDVSRLVTFDAGGGPMVVDQGDDDESFDELVPMVAAGYHVDEETLAYVSATRGFKAGGFNLAAPTSSQITFDPETNWTYELGLRRSFREDRYQLGGAVFLVDWDDMQIALFDPLVGGFVDNAGESESKGVELEGRARILEGLDGFASFGWLDTEFEEFEPDPTFEGNDLPFAPETTWSVGCEYGYVFPRLGRVYASGEFVDVGDFTYDPGNLEEEDYSLAHFRVGVQGKLLGLAVWVRNAFDEEYFPVAFQSNPADPNSFVGESGEPRVLGFTLSVRI